MRINSVLVVGDVILDRYTEGHAARISPEAPVPVVEVTNDRYSLGGAANVAHNLATLGCEVILILPTSENDQAIEEIKRLCASKNITYVPVRCSEHKTPVKTRIVSDGQQIVRLDQYDENTLIRQDTDEILRTFKYLLPQFDAVVLSDYAKGVCSYRLCREVIQTCWSEETPVVVDPKGTDWRKYVGTSVITPNLKELSEYKGCKINNTNEDVAESIMFFDGSESLLVTRASKGMTLKTKTGIEHIPCRARKVFDVTGAGDTAVAVVAALISKKSMIDIAHMANTAAGVVVSKPGTATVSQHELDDPISSKIMSMSQIENSLGKWDSNSESIVVTNGCFDLLHRGHTHLIHKAAEFGDRLIVAVNSDRSVRAQKGHSRPINNEYDRAYTIASIQGVDAVYIFDEDTPEMFIKDISPEVLVKGGDYNPEDVLGGEFADKVEIVDYLQGYSTTNLISRARTKDGKN